MKIIYEEPYAWLHSDHGLTYNVLIGFDTPISFHTFLDVAHSQPDTKFECIDMMTLGVSNTVFKQEVVSAAKDTLNNYLSTTLAKVYAHRPTVVTQKSMVDAMLNDRYAYRIKTAPYYLFAFQNKEVVEELICICKLTALDNVE